MELLQQHLVLLNVLEIASTCVVADYSAIPSSVARDVPYMQDMGLTASSARQTVTLLVLKAHVDD